jgi:hypothetical protein
VKAKRVHSRVGWLALLALCSLAGCGALARCSPKELAQKPVEPVAAPVAPRTPGQFEVAEVILDKKLMPGWDDWGWGKHEYTESGARIALGGFGGIILHHQELPSRYGGVSFRVQVPESYGEFLELQLMYRQVDEQTLPPVLITAEHVAKLPDGWWEVFVPWSALNPTGSPFDRIQIHAKKQIPDDLVPIDKIVLTKGSGAAIQPAAAAAAVRARPARAVVDCARSAIRINPLIYGIADQKWSMKPSARRIGGNPITRLNWDLGNVWNHGKDWFFENAVGPKDKLPEWIAADIEHGMKTALVVPTSGWVAKDATSVGFPKSVFGAQHAHDPNRPEAGDGMRPDNTPIRPGPPTQTSVAAPPAQIKKWIERLRAQDATRGKRGVDMYILDNEPTLWNSTHRDIHPDPLTYDELLDMTVRYGTAIREADHDAVIAGPAEWGWTGYFYSAKDVVAGVGLKPDRRAHDDLPLVEWYLKKLARHEKATGTRILDVLDLHFYPQAPNVWGDGGTDPETAALRLRSTRSLWDPSYNDESWINDTVKLIPRMKEWIAGNYPGRGISIGEWNFGGEKHMSGGLAVAEVLGRFGQQGITSAFYWYSPPDGSPAFNGFLAYRNYDGKGAHFLDWSVPTKDGQDLSLFASRDDSSEHFTLVLLNLDPSTAVDAEIDVSRCGTPTARRAFAYDATLPAFIEDRGKSDLAKLTERLAPYSMKVVELTVSKPVR